MLNHVKIAILEVIDRASRENSSGYFVSRPTLIAESLDRQCSIILSPATVSKYLKMLRIAGYFKGSWIEAETGVPVFGKTISNIELTEKALEFLRLCKHNQNLHP